MKAWRVKASGVDDGIVLAETRSLAISSARASAKEAGVPIQNLNVRRSPEYDGDYLQKFPVLEEFASEVKKAVNRELSARGIPAMALSLDSLLLTP